MSCRASGQTKLWTSYAGKIWQKIMRRKRSLFPLLALLLKVKNFLPKLKRKNRARELRKSLSQAKTNFTTSRMMRMSTWKRFLKRI